jgi:hypothetical protein
MGSGQGGWYGGAVAILLGLVAGCANRPVEMKQALLGDRNPADHGGDVGVRYGVHCPDVMEIIVEAPRPWTCQKAVGPDGCIDLGVGRRRRVEGLTPPETGQVVAATLGVRPQQVRVRVAEFNSQQLYLYGEVAGPPRVVPYRGPETVIDLLQRVGGVSRGAASTDVQVVRAHVADGVAPEVFHVDLQAIVLRHDPRTNICLHPSDEIYVGQLRRCCITNCLPPWFRPFAERLCGMRQQGDWRKASAD